MLTDHDKLTERIKGIISEYPWVWNDLAKVIAIVWKDDIKIMLKMDPKLLTAEGFLNGVWRQKVTDPALICKVFKDLQLINNNHKSNTLNMAKTTEEVVPQRIPILKHLKSGKTLTGLQAWNKYGCYRLSSVINRLNDKGHNIICEILEGNTHGTYTLIA